MPFCTSCGNKLSDLALACPKCGTPNEARLYPSGVPAATGPGLERAFPNAPLLRPFSAGEIVDTAIRLYRNNAGTLLKAVALVVIPVQLISALIQTSATPDVLTNEAFDPALGTAQPTIDTGQVWAYLAAVIITFVISGIAAQLATATSLRALTEAYLGEKPTWKESLRFAFGRLGSLIGLAILSGIGIFIGFLLFIIPGIWLSVSWAVAVPVLLFEGTGGTGALRRSFNLVRKRFWPTLLVLILGNVVAFIIGFVFNIPFTVLSLTDNSEVATFVSEAIGGALSQTLVTPFLAGLVAILYFDLRIRKEGFDIEVLARSVGVEPSSDEAVATAVPQTPRAESWRAPVTQRPFAPHIKPLERRTPRRKPTAPRAKPAKAKPKPVARAKPKPVARAKPKPVARAKPKPKPKPVAKRKPVAKPKPKPKPKPSPKRKPRRSDD